MLTLARVLVDSHTWRARHRPLSEQLDRAERLVPDDTLERLEQDYRMYWSIWAAERRRRAPHDGSYAHAGYLC